LLIVGAVFPVNSTLFIAVLLKASLPIDLILEENFRFPESLGQL